MVATSIPLVFKPLTPFIRRAEELDRDNSRVESRLIAYYCRQYAMERGIELREDDSSDAATAFLLTLMDNLEKEKALMPEFSNEEGKKICQSWAEEIFQRADDEDRAGASTKATARLFYAAGTFFDVLGLFDVEIHPDIQEKTKYAKFKATEILKAVREGRQPTPGGPEDQAQIMIEQKLPAAPTAPPVIPAAMNSAISVASTVAIPSFTGPSTLALDTDAGMAMPPSAPSFQHEEIRPKAVLKTPSVPTAVSYQRQTSGKRTEHEINDALEFSKFAVAALKAREIDLAVDRLEQALARLR